MEQPKHVVVTVRRQVSSISPIDKQQEKVLW